MASTYTMVAYGSQGSAVKQLQNELNRRGYSLNEDGIFGKKTRAAVRDYQKKNGLRMVDGIAGDETWGSLLASPTAEEQAALDAAAAEAARPRAEVTESTARRLQELEKGYTPSDEVAAAREYRDSVAALEPEEYESGFSEKLQALYDQIAGRKAFEYDPEEDEDYQRYAKLYAARGAAVLSAAAAVVLCVYAFLPKSTEGLLLYEGQYSEIKLVNSMIKQLVEDRHDLTVTIQDEMTAVNNFNAMTGDGHTCDLMYTWDGTLLTTIMGLDTTDIPDGQTLYDFVNEKMNDEYDMHMLGKIGVNNTYILGVTQEVVDTYNPKTISDLVPIAGELRFGAEQDFFTDAGNMKFGPMAEAYGLEFAEVKPVDIMMKYTLVEQGAYDVMVVYATDGLNKRANLTLLEDDQHFFPDYYGTILVRNDVFERFADQAPGLEDTLKLLNNQFTDEMMSELTYYVDVEGRDVDEVAHEFLVSAGLLEE